MAWFKKAKQPKPVREVARTAIPEGLWSKCESCREAVYTRDLEANQRVCPRCSWHFRLSSRERIALLLDADSQHELFERVAPVDALDFKDSKRYRDRIKVYQASSGE